MQLLQLHNDPQRLQVLNNPLMDARLFIRIVGSCNGLLCVELSNFGGHVSLLLWNPATREVRQVPKTLNLSETASFLVGFGFSPIVNDYKIVRIFVSEYADPANHVEVYSLSKGLCKRVESDNLHSVVITADGFTANEAILWFGVIIDVERKVDVIVSFDIGKEVFTLIPMPTLRPNLNPIMLTMYDNKLAVVSRAKTENLRIGSSIDLWVMEESKGASKERWIWTKKFTSSPYPFLLLPATIWRNEIICRFFPWQGVNPGTEYELKDYKRKIASYNLTTDEFKMLGISNCNFSYEIFSNAESLVPLR